MQRRFAIGSTNRVWKSEGKRLLGIGTERGWGMSAYRGMRWFKCDLHVHTPEDGSWRDAETRLGDPRRIKKEGTFDETDVQEKARKFLIRCHETGLHLIGVTDHNFSARDAHRDWFLSHLIEQNEPVAESVGRDPLTIFPGFEVDIGYHLVCLFPPVKKSEDLKKLDEIL
ncbi:MAG: hypothetical protein HQL56_00905 [Magnetococcales bacterium]|nr:hypothetical protein [Magnetococcales bacterium]